MTLAGPVAPSACVSVRGTEVGGPKASNSVRRASRKHEWLSTEIFLAFLFLFMGLFLYLGYRPTSLLLSCWAESLQLGWLVVAIREIADDLIPDLPAWTIYSLPFSLWISSYLLFVREIWRDSPRSLDRYTWLFCVPVIACLSELAQSQSLLPGVFDPADLAGIVLAASIGFLPTGRNDGSKSEIL